MERYDINKQAFIPNKKVDKFLKELITLCKKHNVSLSHEDHHGSFIVTKYKDINIVWINQASIDIKEE